MVLSRQTVSVPEEKKATSSAEVLLSRMRRLVLATLVVGITGTGAELLLVGHTEDAWQWVPLFLIVLCAVVLIWHGVAGATASIRALQATMVLFLLGGAAGLALHWRSKVEFKKETDPSLKGMTLFLEAMKSQAPPALAPGVLIQMALLGLAFTYRHPSLARDAKDGSAKTN